ncbi:MAG: antibiotic biosynthesis monooxygenase [Proteobacteria bacterium]|nr:antibiotic biosynthesis monooxygenase [Pseudomonadota bacterium]
MIIVTGDVIARADTIEEMKRVSVEHVHRSRAEEGCISHDVAVDAEKPLRLIFFERWADEAVLKKHFAVPESRAFWRKLQELASDPGKMTIYRADKIKFG